MSGFSQGNRKASKLSVPQVIEIRLLYEQGKFSQGALARRFQVSVIQIGRIVRGEVWQNLPVLDPVMSEGEVKESAARMLALSEKVAGSGTAKLQETAADLNKGNVMLDELTNSRSPLDE